ncbi:MAG: Crp/Fnr family transcriptional regulator [Desulfovibrionaceae bacterium]|nr:Crp/Fnr family transcriptional regulator [Desulfovibrionaceae bacterium]MBF0513869.1 Crp/Fnr family transcriptional regulator [Desulfovibrionaceae bacterium]
MALKKFSAPGCPAPKNDLLLDPEVGRKLSEMAGAAPWLADMSWEEVVDLAGYLRLREYLDGQAIFQEGDTDPFMGVILSGMVEITKKDQKDASDKSLVRMGPGRAFGEFALIDGEPRSASAWARQPARLLILTREDLLQLSRAKKHLAFKLVFNIASMMSRRLRQTSERLMEYL